VWSGSRSQLYSVQSALGLVASGRVLLACGDREAAERAWGDLARLAADDGDLTIDLWARASHADLAFVDGPRRSPAKALHVGVLRQTARPRVASFRLPHRHENWIRKSVDTGFRDVGTPTSGAFGQPGVRGLRGSSHYVVPGAGGLGGAGRRWSAARRHARQA
jgi:hypothetical protein